MFIHAEKRRAHWLVTNQWGHALELPCSDDLGGQTVRIGVFGTRMRAAVPGSKTKLVAEMFAALKCPLYILDTRRNGVGAQSSWSPLEFATLVPQMMGGEVPYAYLHLPSLAPSVELLKANRDGSVSSWWAFQRRYVTEHGAQEWDIGRAFVEAAVARDGLAVFLCAEPDQPDFDYLPAAEQEEHYCHRFTLAQQVAHRLRSAFADVSVALLHLDPVDFHGQRQAGTPFTPRTTPL